MSDNTYHEAPLIKKTPVSLIVLENSDLEGAAIRSVLEYFGFRVDTHWVGSRKELIEILKGNIPTEDFIILSNHGDETEGMYTCPGEKPLQGNEIGDIAKLNGKSILSLGCFTGLQDLAQGFLKAGCDFYVGPTDAPFGNTALLFAIHVAYEISQHKKKLGDAVEIARSYNQESEMFRIFQKDSIS